MKQYKYRSVLTIAGSDSSGGAGIQADLKTMAALGCFGASAITAATAQNTRGVTAIHSLPPEFIAEQIRAVLDDLNPLAIKIGMIPNAVSAKAISSILTQYPAIPVVMDPVMVATSGDRLIEEETLEVLKTELFPKASIITPNLDEVMVLIGKRVNGVQEMTEVASELLALGSRAVLVKGGHLVEATLYNIYLESGNKPEQFAYPAIHTTNTHGTGCTLSSAIAAFIARGYSLRNAVVLAGDYVQEAIKHGSDVKVGQGYGPVNHFFNPQALKKYEYEGG